MKKQLLLLFALMYWAVCFSQINKEENNLALDLIRANRQAIGLSDKDLNDLIISGTYETNADHIRMVYLLQAYKNIPVFNQMQVLAFRNNQLVSTAGSRIPGIETKVNNPSATPQLGPSEAVRSAVQECKLVLPALLFPYGQSGSKTMFGDLGIAENNITAEPVWLPVSGKEIRLTWEIDIAPQKSADHWLIRVDAATGKVLDKNNLTVYEQFPHLENADEASNLSLNDAASNSSDNNSLLSPLVVNSATYRVIPFPAESPNHPGGTPSLVTDPWNLAPGNATSLKWHYDGTAYRDSTRGNNVWAQEDRDNNNNSFGKTAISTTAQPTLSFDFAPNFTLAPTTTVNQQFATTNLFYWNNLMHDITYLYGFDELSGNFQQNNQGRGGLGNDYVIADAQDAGGTNNANFSTPVDGSRPRMQMYLFTGTTPNRDGDLDNGIVIHEYGHGVSTRLTGGPANSSCLNNAEQGGEGWSDYFALMLTTNWATAQVTDGSLAKPMGTYALNQAITGGGIRTYPYSTNMAINPWTYANMASSGGEVHVIGEIWCTALWEMTWEMILQDGINTNLFNPSGTGGNSAALKLVTEGMRLQPCSPGYIDARNAILKADTLFFGAKYSCAIWKAFAKRGMGQGASQGSSNSTTDQTASFVNNGGLSLLLTQSVTSQQEGLNVTYTNHVSAGTCSGISNYLLTDTLPSNVTYVSGGTYNAANRVVSFPVTLAQGASQDYSFTVQVNPGSYFPSASLINESVAGTAIPAGWAATTATGTTNWAVSTTQSHSAPRSLFALDNSAAITDFRLATTTPIALGAVPPVFTFWHYYNTEAGWDGGVVEISTNGGTSWNDLGSNFTSNGYNGSVGGTNPIAGRSAFTGNSGGFIQSKISLLPYANQNALFRFRATSDDNTAATGWYVDDIVMNSLAVVNMRSNLFNSSGIRVNYSDTVTIILPTSCVTGTFSAHPVNTAACANGNANFSVVASGTALTYQWQVSTDGGSNFSNILNETSSSLLLSGVNASMNNNKYRCNISGTCTSLTSSNTATLTVNALPAAPAGTNGVRCSQGTVTISASAGPAEVVDWYAAASGGSPLLSGSAIFTTTIIGTTTVYYAESRNTGTGCVSAARTAVTATVNSNPLSASGTNASRCGAGTITIAATPGAGETIDWYSASGGGSLLLSGSTSYSPSISTTTTYYAEARNINTGCVSLTRIAVTATINSNPSTPLGTSAARCGAGTVTITATPGAGETIDWYAAFSGGTPLLSGSNTFTTPTISSTTSYYAEARNTATGCLSASRVAVIATINSIPAAPSGVPDFGCGPSIVSLSASVNAGETVDWYASATGGSALISGSNNYDVSVSSTTTFFAEARNINTGCVSATRTPVTATVNAVTNSTTAVSICATSLPYSWNNYSFNAGGTYTVVLVNAAGCDSLAKLLLDVVAAINIKTVTGGGSYTTGGSGLPVGLNGSEIGVSYQLLLNGNAIGTPVAGTGAALNFGNQLQAGTYTVNAVIGPCSQLMSGSATIMIVSGPPAQFTVTGGGTYCSGGSGVTVGLSGSQTGVNYQLRRSNGTINVGSPVAGTGSAISFGLQTVAADYSVLATNTVSMATQQMLNSMEVRIASAIRAPSAPGAITGPADACPYMGISNVTYTIRQVANATSYLWTAPAGATIIGNNTDTMVVIQYPTSFTAGTLSVVSVNACFNNATSAARTLSVIKKVPPTPGAITASLLNPCSIVGTGATATYTIRQVANATGYTWTLSSGITFMSNLGDTGVVVRFENGFTSGTVSVVAFNNCATSAARTLAVTSTIPSMPAAISGFTNVCSYIGQAATATYSIAAVTGVSSYIWTAPANATISSGQGTTSVALSVAANFSSGTLTVKSVAACGSSAVRSLALVKNIAKPGAITASALACPASTVTYTIATVSYATSYIWSLPANAIYISGQGTTSFTVSYNASFASGIVSVKSVNNCSTSAASSLAVSASACRPSGFARLSANNSTLTIPQAETINIYPNPCHGIFNVELYTKATMSKVTIQLLDVYGKIVKDQQETVQKNGTVQGTVNATNLPSGIYEVRYYNGNITLTKKIVIAH